MKIITLYNEVLEYRIRRLIGTENEVKEYFIKNNLDDEFEIGNCGFSYNYKCNGYMYLPNDNGYVLVHELIHIIQGILDYKGIDTGYENTEILAYNVDWAYKKLSMKYYNYSKKTGKDGGI